MAKKHYTYDPKSDTFMQIKSSPKKKAFKAIAYSASVLISSFALYFIFSFYLPSPREASLTQQLQTLTLNYNELNAQLQDMTAVVDNIKDRDADVYELLLGAPPIDDHIWDGGIGGHDIEGEVISDEVSLQALNNSMEDLERKIVLHSKYLDDVEKTALEDDLKRSHIPSIRPIQTSKSDAYVRLLSGYGMRMHPVHKVNKMHKGIDFPAKKGTPIVATGDGKVVKVRRQRSGYGRHIVIDHGFGYKSLYAHLDAAKVKVGEEVKRGQEIGTLGRTGTATAPHVHYEVHKDGRAINPIHYCMDGLTPEEYNLLLHSACQHNHSFD